MTYISAWTFNIKNFCSALKFDFFKEANPDTKQPSHELKQIEIMCLFYCICFLFLFFTQNLSNDYTFFQIYLQNSIFKLHYRTCYSFCHLWQTNVFFCHQKRICDFGEKAFVTDLKSCFQRAKNNLSCIHTFSFSYSPFL